MYSITRKSPTLVQSTMKQFKCTASEAQQWLDTPINNAFLFSSGETHIPFTIKRDKNKRQYVTQMAIGYNQTDPYQPLTVN